MVIGYLGTDQIGRCFKKKIEKL
nr:hypothetical protein [Arsenophonus endosymbiont of Aleurodicus floccissimus]